MTLNTFEQRLESFVAIDKLAKLRFSHTGGNPAADFRTPALVLVEEPKPGTDDFPCGWLPRCIAACRVEDEESRLP